MGQIYSRPISAAQRKAIEERKKRIQAEKELQANKKKSKK